MALCQQRWTPRTCGCVLTLAYDRDQPDATMTGVDVVPCPAHAALTAHQAYLAILAAQRAGGTA